MAVARIFTVVGALLPVVVLGLLGVVPGQPPVEEIVAAVLARQRQVQSEVPGASFLAEYTYRESTERSQLVKELYCRRRVFLNRSGVRREEYQSVQASGRELGGRERDRVLAELRRSGMVAGGTRMPFDPDAPYDYRYNLQGRTTWDGHAVWVVGFTPRVRRDDYIEGWAFVLESGADVVRLEFRPARLPFVVRSMTMALTYGPVQQCWLPVALDLAMEVNVRLVLTLYARRIQVTDRYRDYVLRTAP